MTDLYTEANNMRDQLVSWRRDLHQHPEPGMCEFRTAGIVAEHLQRLGYQVRTGVGGTGVIGLLSGVRPGPVVMFRFDMDALPVTEETGAEYASQVAGQMHGCGHDGHVAMGMGLAQLLAARRDQISGQVKLVFQPAEERGTGAAAMVKDGALENPRPDVFLSTHVWIEKPVGTVDVTSGPVMAAADAWSCTLQGRGGHGAMPEQTVDPIVAAAQVICTLQTVVSRNVSALDTAVVSVGSIHAGDALNVIPAQVTMKGTIRTYQPSTRNLVLQRVRQVVEGVSAACGASAEFETNSVTPAVINDAQVTQVVRRAAEMIVGAQNVSNGERTMGSEDASYFMQQIPGCYFFLGASNAEKGFAFPHHNSRFDFDEQALVLGVAILAQAASSYLTP